MLTGNVLVTPTMAAWAAGFLDGEGCFRIYTHRSHGREARSVVYDFQVNAVQVDPAPLLLLRSMFGGAVHVRSGSDNNGRALSYVWVAPALRARALIPLIRPFLHVKGKQADLLMKFAETIGTKGKRVTEEVMAQRHELYEEARELNRRGIAKGDPFVKPTGKIEAVHVA